MTVIANSHVFLDEQGVPRIEGSGARVAMVVMDKLNGMTAEDIHASYPHLSLAQIYAAFSYYYDHRLEMDAQIAREAEDVAARRTRAIAESTQPTREELEARLRERGKSK